MTEEHEISLEELMAQFQAEEPPEMEACSRGAWMAQADAIEGVCSKVMMGCVTTYNQYGTRLMEVQGLKQKISDLEENGFRVKFMKDEEGNLSFEATEKDKMGFVK